MIIFRKDLTYANVCGTEGIVQLDVPRQGESAYLSVELTADAAETLAGMLMVAARQARLVGTSNDS